MNHPGRDNELMQLEETLRGACSQLENERRPAEEKLLEWETQPGFYAALVEVLRLRQQHYQVRLIAALCLKNGVERYWRSTAPRCIADEEKQILRNGFLTLLDEPENQVAIQIAVIIAKVARIDCPREWPQLLPNLLSIIQSGMDNGSPLSLVQHRALLTLLHVTKVLASKRLAGDRRFFHQFSVDLFPLMHTVHLQHTNSPPFLQLNTQRGLINLDDSTLESICDSLQRIHVTTRILRKLTIHGFTQPGTHTLINQFVSNCLERGYNLLQIRRDLIASNSISTTLLDQFDQLVVQTFKVPLQLLDHHPYAFIPFINLALNVSTQTLFGNESTKLLFERVIVQCLTLIKSVVKCPEYKPNKSSVANTNKDCGTETLMGDDGAEMTVETDEGDMGSLAVTNFFTQQPQMIREVFRSLISQYLILSEDELNSWSADAEEFAAEEIQGGEAWRYNLRLCAQATLEALHQRFHQEGQLIPLLLHMLQNECPPGFQANNSVNQILLKDAVYLAVGLMALDLFDEMDPSIWYERLYKDLTESGHLGPDGRKVICRRIGWLVGATCDWFAPEQATRLCENLLLPLMANEQDMAVRLAAAQAVRALFDRSAAAPPVEPCLTSPLFYALLRLIIDAKNCDTKMTVLYVMSFLVQRMGPHMDLKQTKMLSDNLPALWTESNEHSMLRCAIVNTLYEMIFTQIITLELKAFACEVVKYCTNIEEPEHVYLMEDGLRLWAVIAEMEPDEVISNDKTKESLIALFSTRMPVLLEEASTEYLELLCRVINCHVTNSGVHLMSDVLVTRLANLMEGCNAEGVLYVSRTLLTALSAMTAASISIPFNSIVPVLRVCIDRLCDQQYVLRTMSVASCLEIIAHVLLYSTDSFLQVVGSDQALSRIIVNWLRHMSRIAQPVTRKRCAMALAALLPTAPSTPSVQQALPSILNSLLECLHDIVHISENDELVDGILCPRRVLVDVLLMNENDSEDKFDKEFDTFEEGGEKNPFALRMRRLALVDPVHTISFVDFLQTQINKLRSHFAGSNDAQWLSLLGFYGPITDNTLLTELRQFVNI